VLNYFDYRRRMIFCEKYGVELLFIRFLKIKKIRFDIIPGVVPSSRIF
jgi:hypothetical protein